MGSDSPATTPQRPDIDPTVTPTLAPTVGPAAAPPALPRMERIDAAIGVAIAAIIALIAPVTVLLPAFAKIERGALWGVVVLIAMAGWGSGVERLAFPRRRADLGLRMAWGAAALIAVGGLLSLLSLARAPVILILVLGGVAWQLAGVVRERRDVGARVRAWLHLWPKALFLVFLALAVLAAAQYLAGASGQYLNANDDQAAYMIFPKKLMATGTLLDPFNMRRITAYGGHSFLQALTIIGAASPMQISLLDVGISLVIVLALVLGTVGDKMPRALRPFVALALLFVLTLPNIRLNTASEVSGVFFFLAMFRTAASARFKESPAETGVVLALLGAGACTLRQSYLVPVAVFMAVLYLPAALAAVRASGEERKRQLIAIGRTAGFLLLFIAPWAVLSYRSHGTFLFPLSSGTYHTEYGGFTTHSAGVARLKFLWLNICHCHPVTTLPFFLIAGALISSRRDNGALRAILWAALIGFFTVVISLPLSDRWNIARYYYGFAVAAILAIIISAFSVRWRARTGGLRTAVIIPALLVVGAIVAQIQAAHGELHGMYDAALSTIVSASVRPSRLDDTGQAYRKLQATIPEGAAMIVMVDEPFWFDYRRNPIDSLDLPGAASPAPGMPLDDDEAVASYLQAQGFRYLVFVRASSSKSLYRRDTWHKHLTSTTTAEIWRMSAPFYLKTFDRFDGLAKSRVSVFDDGTMVALDLARKVPPPPPKAEPKADVEH